jgi:hypothetical protein
MHERKTNRTDCRHALGRCSVQISVDVPMLRFLWFSLTPPDESRNNVCNRPQPVPSYFFHFILYHHSIHRDETERIVKWPTEGNDRLECWSCMSLYPQVSPVYCMVRIYGTQYWETVRKAYWGKAIFVRFEVFTAVATKNAVFWNVTPRGSCKNRLFGGTYRLHHEESHGVTSQKTAFCKVYVSVFVVVAPWLFQQNWSLFCIVLTEPNTTIRVFVTSNVTETHRASRCNNYMCEHYKTR